MKIEAKVPYMTCQIPCSCIIHKLIYKNESREFNDKPLDRVKMGRGGQKEKIGNEEEEEEDGERDKKRRKI